MMSWHLPYTAHLGYRPPFQGMFTHLAGSSDPVAQVSYAASIDLAGVLYPWVLDRPELEIQKVAEALEVTGLGAGVVVGVPAVSVGESWWTNPSHDIERLLERHTAKACAAAVQLGSGAVAAIVADTSHDREHEERMDVAQGRLTRLARIAADHGVVLGLEAMVSVPSSVLRSTAGALELVERCGHASIGLIFDTGHSAMMGEDVRGAFDAAYERMAVMQFARGPERLEPRSEDSDLVAIGRELVCRGWEGMVDLEHGWSEEGLAGENRGVSWLQEFDAAVAVLQGPGDGSRADTTK